jgi:predicted small lipoprotein YifL
MRIRTVTVAALLIGTLTACGSSDDPKPADATKLDTAAQQACDDFANAYDGAQTEQARTDLADKVNGSAKDSGTDRIAKNAAALVRGSEAGPDAWKMGADAFAQACLDAGWKA